MPTTDTQLGKVLLAQARQAIADALGLPAPAAPEHPQLAERGATFVTLTRDGELRGCIGSLNAHRPLGQDVRDNAVSAALRDPRFPPLSAAEFADVRVEVSLLTEPDFIEFRDEADALAQLEPGRDGVIFFFVLSGYVILWCAHERDATPTAYAKIGIGICWDQWFPETARGMALKGAEILFYPTAIGSEPILECDSMPHWRRCMTGHAACNLMPVVAANRIGTEEVVPCAENGNQSSALTFYGSSFITDATGEVVEQMDRVTEGFILHSFDLDELESERKSWGLFRDRRPEMYGEN